MRIVDCKQYTAEWWEARRGLPTTSEFGNILTPKRREFAKAAETYAHQLIAEQYDPMYGEVDEYVSAGMKNGIIMEPTVRRWYEFERDHDVRQVGFCLTDDGRFGCSPDGLVGEDGGLECKSPKPATQVKWLLAGGVPDEYLCQVHGALIVTGRPWWDFLSYSTGLPPLLVRVEPNDFTDRLREALEEFWTLYTKLRDRIAAMNDGVLDHAVREAQPEAIDIPF